jgi:hypothetical protein
MMAVPDRLVRLDVDRQIDFVPVFLGALRRALRALHAMMPITPSLELDATLAQRIQGAHE